MERDVEGYAESWGDGFKVMLNTTLLYKPRALLSRSHPELLSCGGTAQPSPKTGCQLFSF